MEWFFNLHGGYANFTIIPILVYMYYQNNFCMQVIKMQPQEKKNADDIYQCNSVIS